MAAVLLIHRATAMISTLLPILSFAGGGASVAFTMYARTVEFRLVIVARDTSGALRHIAPSTLARRVVPSAVPFFAGADHFRRTYGEVPLGRHLGEVARLVCASDPGRPVEVDLTLVERRRGGVQELHEHARCER